MYRLKASIDPSSTIIINIKAPLELHGLVKFDCSWYDMFACRCMYTCAYTYVHSVHIEGMSQRPLYTHLGYTYIYMRVYIYAWSNVQVHVRVHVCVLCTCAHVHRIYSYIHSYLYSSSVCLYACVCVAWRMLEMHNDDTWSYLSNYCQAWRQKHQCSLMTPWHRCFEGVFQHHFHVFQHHLHHAILHYHKKRLLNCV